MLGAGTRHRELGTDVSLKAEDAVITTCRCLLSSLQLIAFTVFARFAPLTIIGRNHVTRKLRTNLIPSVCTIKRKPIELSIFNYIMNRAIDNYYFKVVENSYYIYISIFQILILWDHLEPIFFFFLNEICNEAFKL